MTVYEFIKHEDSDFDIYDNEFDKCVTVCAPYYGEFRDNSDVFEDEILKRVRLIRKKNDYEAVADWSGFIKFYINEFRNFAKKHWISIPNDEDSLVSAWIKELHLYFAGYVSVEFYKVLLDELIGSLK